ncbi:MAG: chemotaxis protein CheW, partial [Lachnospiraceae bacterium]|nr:chemotaxis protein CheW [Lachnospiraceae bacterium]
MADFKPVVFKLDEELYGLDILRVQGIERDQQVVRVPNTASYIKGIMNLRGNVIPVYSLRKKFNLPDTANTDIQYIIVSANGN